MKIILLNLLIIFIIKNIYCDLYIDLRTNYISKGVIVYHGRFMDNGKYIMFMGDNEPLKRVYYDNKIVYPPYFLEINNHDLFVEVFKTKNLFYVQIHSILDIEDQGFRYTRVYLQYGYKTFKRISYKTFINNVNFVVYLSVDISKNKLNPFVNKTIIDNNKEIYKVINKFNDKSIENIKGPSYTFGNIYDSTKPIIIGYTKLNVFINNCEYFEIIKRFILFIFI